MTARDVGVLEPLPPLEPATPEAVAEAEEEIGYPLLSLRAASHRNRMSTRTPLANQ
jgi:hypothetical protein